MAANAGLLAFASGWLFGRPSWVAAAVLAFAVQVGRLLRGME
ncbi:MAG TPA: hypothetical protein VIL95_03045 [Bacillota bacterium]